MADIKLQRDGGILAVTMARGKANTLNLSMVEELNAAIEEAARDDGIRGLVLGSDRPRFFSAGFDLGEVSRYDRDTMTLFFSRFVDLYESIYLLPKPAVAAVSGHAYAGGAILAIACDVRVMALGDFGFALNEINLGLLLPPAIVRIAICAAGANNARQMILCGDPITPARALQIGLVQALAEPDKVAETALSRCASLAQKPASAFAATKYSLREIAEHQASADDEHFLDAFIERWFSKEAEEYRKVLLESLSPFRE